MADYGLTGFNITDKVYEILTLAAEESISSVGVKSFRAATASVSGMATSTQITKLDGVEALADVTDKVNVLAALALDTTAKDMGGGNITNVGTVDGRNVSTDGTKLDGVEALADVTDKTNVLAALAIDATAKDMGAGAITNVGNVDGRDVSTDGTKLDGIDVGATDDQTGAEIKTAYEAEADTNALTDTLLSKLNGIEALADVTDPTNVAAAGALMENTFNVQTVMVSVLDNSPLAQAIGDSELVGRPAGGDIGAVTKAQALAILGVEDGADKTDWGNVGPAIALASGDIDVNNQKITNLAPPTNNTDAVTMAYADQIAAGKLQKDACEYATAATLGAVTFDYNGGANGRGIITAVANGALSVDGASPAASNRILVKDQPDHQASSIGFNSGTKSDYVDDYVTIYNEADTAYHFWFDTTGVASAPGGATNPVKVDISGESDAAGFTLVFQGVVDGTAGFNSLINSDLGSTYAIVVLEKTNSVTASATTDAVAMTVYNYAFGGASGGGSRMNGIYVVQATGDGSNPFILEWSEDQDNIPNNEVKVGIETWVIAGTVNDSKGFTQIDVANDTDYLIRAVDTQRWTQSSSTTVYTEGAGIDIVGGVISVDIATGMTVATGKVGIDYAAGHTYQSTLNIANTSDWELAGVPYGGTMPNLNKLTGLDDASDLHYHLALYDKGSRLLRQNCSLGMVLVQANEGSGEGLYLADASDPDLSNPQMIADETETAGNAINGYLPGSLTVLVYMDKDQTGGAVGDKVVLHPTRPGVCTMANDFTTGYFVVVGYLETALVAGDNISDSSTVITQLNGNESKILISP